MSRFSKYAVLGPIEHRFELEPKLWWKFRPATSRDELTMTTFVTTETRNPTADNGVAVRYPSRVEIAWREIATLTVATNIPTSEIVEGQEPTHLPDNPSVSQVEALLAEMPHQMVMELWGALGDANPGWGPRKEKNSKSSGN